MNPVSFVYKDVNDAYFELHTLKKHFTEWEETRNGKALAFQAPVIVTYTMPYRRVLFDPIRDANPFFHYMEALWILAGSNLVEFPAYFASNIRNYSDDGEHLHGAYGYRWRNNWDYDQLDEVIDRLANEPTTRQAVLCMWDPSFDNMVSKDIPCNTHVYFRRVEGKLTMTVCNRSNDLVWGMLGANVVHMGIMHEYVAHSAGMQVGDYHQFTNNLHVYEDWVDKYYAPPSNWYYDHPSVNRWEFRPENINLSECEDFVEDRGESSDRPWKSRILRDNAAPMMEAWKAYKSDLLDLALHLTGRIHDEDWREACRAWMERRLDARK